ncbi:hypothetical protein [Pyxidicoccus trucidator]|uniref:hypothetical protein n=1 Tax=Pyxidicoccus trucidator TaxID=2709662 RepID=UPI0013DAD085|nr:hypothetical protein [Pyxidicoccus trucidator]
MRLFHRLAPAGLATLLTLALPLTQAHAEDCVTFSGLKHCGLGSAQLAVEGKELHVVSPDASERDGVAISTEGSTFWSAGFRSEPSGRAVEQTVLTGESEGAAASTATIATEGGRTSFAATFTAATQETSTYTAEVFSNGRLVGSVSNVRSGRVAFISYGPVIGGTTSPGCTNLPYNQCMQQCRQQGNYLCGYCSIPCRRTFDRVDENGACRWTLQVQRASFALTQGLADGETVEGDTVVLTEDIVPGGSYPYLNFDRILVETNAKTTTLTDVTANGGK